MAGSDDVVRQLLAISRDVEPRLLNALRERGHDRLRPSFAGLLYLIWDEPRPLAEIAEALGVSRQAASQLATRVEEAGYAERRPNPFDARSRLVAITPRGRAVDDDRAHEAIAKCEAHYEAIIGVAAMRDLVESLGLLRDGFDVPSHPASARASLGVLPLVALAARDAVLRSIISAGHGAARSSYIEILPLLTAARGRPIEVARIQGVTRQAVGATLQDLERLGYCRRTRDLDDQRGVVFVPTVLGQRLIEADTSARLALDSWFGNILTRRRHAAFRSAVRRLAEELQPHRTDLEELAASLRSKMGRRDIERLAALLVQESL